MKNKRNTSYEFAATRRAIAAIDCASDIAQCKQALTAIMAAGVAPLKARLTLRAAMLRAGLRVMRRGSENIFARTARERRKEAQIRRRYPMVAELDRLYKEAQANA